MSTALKQVIEDIERLSSGEKEGLKRP